MSSGLAAGTVSRIAVLIDAENVSLRALGSITTEACRLGRLVVARAYGNFASPALQPWAKGMQDLAIVPVQVAPLVTGKNAADIRFVIDAMDLLHRHSVDTFCIASSDSDFSALASRIREEGVHVHGFGDTKALPVFARWCDRFYCTDQGRWSDQVADLNAPEPRGIAKPAEPVLPAKVVSKPPAKLLQALDEAAQNGDGWADLSAVGSVLRRLVPGFKPSTHGHASLSRLVKAVSDLETRQQARGSGIAIEVRRKPRRAAA